MSKGISYGKRKQRGGLQESLDTSVKITENEFRDLIRSDENKYEYYCFDDRCNQILFLDTKAEDYEWLFIQLPLESIDNANPSEALKCLEYICKILNEKRIDVKWLFKHDYNTIKQALLKHQEPKKYLTWKDLEFTSEDQTIKVRMGDTVYKILYRRCDGIEEVQTLSEDEKLLYLNFIGKYKDNVQFFNDLHLERVEE